MLGVISRFYRIPRKHIKVRPKIFKNIVNLVHRAKGIYTRRNFFKKKSFRKLRWKFTKKKVRKIKIFESFKKIRRRRRRFPLHRIHQRSRKKYRSLHRNHQRSGKKYIWRIRNKYIWRIRDKLVTSRRNLIFSVWDRRKVLSLSPQARVLRNYQLYKAYVRKRRYFNSLRRHPKQLTIPPFIVKKYGRAREGGRRKKPFRRYYKRGFIVKTSHLLLGRKRVFIVL